MVARDEALGLEDVGAELIDVACGSRVVSCGLDTSGEGPGLYLESLDVICLPAVEGEVEVLHLSEYLLGIDAEGGIALLGDSISFVD